MTTLVAPARIRGIGKLVYGSEYGAPYKSSYGTKYGSRRWLGDAGIYNVPQIEPKPDMDHVLTPEELGSISFNSGDEAIAYYNWLVRMIALQTKLAFSADLWAKVKQSPEMIGALAVTESGRAWLNIFANAEAAFMSFTQPNLFQNFQLIRNYLEVNLLPRQYRTGVKGRLPAFIAGAAELSYTDVIVDSSSFVGMVNFGDLTGTSLEDDAKYANDLVKKFAPTVRLGVWPTVVVAIVAVTVVILATFVFAMVTDYIQAKRVPKEILDKIRDADPQTVERILKQWGDMNGFLASLSDVFMWGAIGLGIFTVGGISLWFASK